MEDKRKEFIATIKKVNLLKLIYQICTITCILLLIAAMILINLQSSNIALWVSLAALLFMITIFVLFYVINHYNRISGRLRDSIILDKKENG